MPAQGSVRVVRFGDYDLDLESNELRKHGHKVPVPDQAFQILAMLLERPGEIVSREQLIARLWPNGTTVEFDHGINSSVRRLRAALNDSADRPRYIETLPKRGYRFIFPVQASEQVPTGKQDEESAPPPEDPPNQSKRKWLWAATTALAFCALGLFTFMRAIRTEPISSIAILPLVNTTHDPNTEYLSDGISEEIINALSAAHHLKVIARTSAFRFKGKDVDPQKAGRELSVGTVLSGTFARFGDAVVVQTDLIKVSDGAELWGARYNRRLSELQTLQSEIAPEIANNLRLKLGGEDEKRLTKRYTENGEAYELYLRAAHTAEYLEQIEYLKRSIAKDPNFALAYVRLAYCYNEEASDRVLAAREALSKARDAATRALELDESLAEAHIELARVLMNLDWDWKGAGRELKRAIALSPNLGHIDYSLYLTFIGRPQEALVEAQRAEQIDPISLELQGRIAHVYHANRQFEKAIQKARAPHVTRLAEIVGAFALAETGQYSESIAVLKAAPGAAGVLGHIGYAYARAGNRAEAESICRELQQSARKEGVGAYEVAFIYGALGKKDEGFRWLDIAYEQHDPGLRFLKVDACLDPLRSDPRFNELVGRVGLSL